MKLNIELQFTAYLLLVLVKRYHFFSRFNLTLYWSQFCPLDIPVAVDAFLGYWKPSAIIIIEGELWPNLIMGASKHGVSYSFLLMRVLLPADLLLRKYKDKETNLVLLI